MSDDPIAFLAARLDEDERIAGEATRCDGAWPHGGWTPGFFAPADFPAELDEHITRHDPARVLREVEAKRRILAETWGGPDHQDMWEHHARLLASVYSDHPDYRQEWKP